MQCYSLVFLSSNVYLCVVNLEFYPIQRFLKVTQGSSWFLIAHGSSSLPKVINGYQWLQNQGYPEVAQVYSRFKGITRAYIHSMTLHEDT